GGKKLVFEAGFDDFRLTQIWTLEISGEKKITWSVDLKNAEHVRVDEFRFLALLDPCFKMWFMGHKQDYFPRLDRKWYEFTAESLVIKTVGARYPLRRPVPSVLMRTKCKDLRPIVQSPPREMNARIAGYCLIPHKIDGYYGNVINRIFSGDIELFDSDEELDKGIENARKCFFAETAGKRVSVRGQGDKVVLVNLPWNSGARGGVRAGSRWPHIKDETEGDYLPFPFFLAYSKSLLEKHGIEALVVDAIAENISVEDLLLSLASADAGMLVVETSTPSFCHDMRAVKILSKMFKHVVVCGPHQELYSENVLKERDFINFALYGEYEYTLLELALALKRGEKNLSSIKGLIWNSGTAIIKNAPRKPFDINLLPWPHRETLPMMKYSDRPGGLPEPSAQMVASRGCPFLCGYCLWPQMFFRSGSHRAREIDDVADEMEYLVRAMGFKSVYFDDDTFNIGKERVIRLCKAIRARGLERVPWAVMAKADLMDEELLREMKHAGLYAVKYGVESASQRLINRSGKNLDLSLAERNIMLTKSIGIKTHLTFMFGLPGETGDTIKKTVELAVRLDPDSVQFSIVTPFPGTKLFEDLDGRGQIITKDWSLYDGHHNCVFRPEKLNPGELEEARRYAYRMWWEHRRVKRGFAGDAKRFMEYWTAEGLVNASKKAVFYLDYLIFHKDKHIRNGDHA
ncbi:MAG: radical SAM protein, partial [Candidatus Omnitrophota bacterium]